MTVLDKYAAALNSLGGDMHRENHKDVETAFATYRALTGDKTAKLERDGACWRIAGSTIGAELEAYGAGIMCGLIRAFCAGWKARIGA